MEKEGKKTSPIHAHKQQQSQSIEIANQDVIKINAVLGVGNVLIMIIGQEFQNIYIIFSYICS